MFSIDSNGILRSDILVDLGWLDHGFQTRGSDYLPSYFRVAGLKQIHTDQVLVATTESGVLGEADALVSCTPGTLLTIKTADCVPVLMVDPLQRAVAAVHAGWRGTVAGVVLRAVETLVRQFGSEPKNLLIAVGPCIRRDAFEVGPEVATQFQSLFPDRQDLSRRTTVDLVEACSRQLTSAGIPASAILDSGRCSFSEPDSFHSFRRDRHESGRMLSFIGIQSTND